MADSWTSIGGNTLDWSGKVECHSAWDALEAIRQAIKERCIASSTSVPTLLNSEVVQLHLFKEYTDAIQSIITTLIPKFVNHTDNGGDWSGQSSIPARTESSLMSYLSETRLSVDQIDAWREWAKQQYKILNMLRWIKSSFSMSHILDTNNEKYITRYPSNDFATMRTDFNANTWGYKEASFDWYPSYISYYRPGFNIASAIYRGRAKNTYSNASGFSIDCDYYGYFTSVNVNNVVNGGYWNGDYGSTSPDTYQKIESHTINNSNSYDFWIGDISDAPDEDPSTYPNYTCGWECRSTVIVIKFDGAGGFAFKNW